MGTIVYSNLVDLLLREGDKTKGEIISESINHFGFPEKGLDFKIDAALTLKQISGYVIKNENGKYSLSVEGIDKMIKERKEFLEYLSKAPKDYFNERPHIKKLKQALESEE